jgi:hypothetical protein
MQFAFANILQIHIIQYVSAKVQYSSPLTSFKQNLSLETRFKLTRLSYHF